MTSPHQLALAYDRYASALWRGEVADARAFAVWLEEYWTDEGPVELADHPCVVSILGGAGAGIRWYARGKTIVGYVGSQSPGCYQVPIDTALPALDICRT
jgi:hypothetical protein